MEMDSKGLSLKARLIGGFGLLLLVIVVISAIAFNSIQTAQTMVEQLTKSQMVQQQRMQEVANQANLIARVVRNIQIIGNATDKDAESAAREFSAHGGRPRQNRSGAGSHGGAGQAGKRRGYAEGHCADSRKAFAVCRSAEKIYRSL
jgi:hypothetical protein